MRVARCESAAVDAATNGFSILQAQSLILASAPSLRPSEHLSPSDPAGREACRRLTARGLLEQIGRNEWHRRADARTLFLAYNEARLAQRAVRKLIDRALRDPLHEIETEIGGYLDSVAETVPDFFELIEDESELRIRRWHMLLGSIRARRVRDGLPMKKGGA